MNIMRAMAVLFFAGAALTFYEGAMGDEETPWGDLPELNFKTCVRLTQQAEPNLSTVTVNDFILVTAYEEKQDKPEEINENQRFLNTYLIGGLFMITGSRGVYLPSQLIVDHWDYDADAHIKRLYKWILSDSDKNGLLDDAVFQTVVKDQQNNIVSEDEMKIPDEELQRLQDYYQDAIQRMNEKREKDAVGMCIPI